MFGIKKKKDRVLTAEEARLQSFEQTAKAIRENKVDPEKVFADDPEFAKWFNDNVKHDEERAKKIAKKVKRSAKMEAALKKAFAREEAIKKLHEAEDDKPKSKRTRKYETVEVKVPYCREIINFTTPELLDLFGGWFTLTYAFSMPIKDRFNEDGTPVLKDYYICSRDVSAMLPSDRPKKNAAIKKLFNKDVYGYAIIAPASAFDRKGCEEE